MLRNIWKWILILIGGFIYSLGLNAFLVSNHLVEGGFVGVSLLLLYEFRWPLGVTFFVLNIPLLIAASRTFGHQFVLRTAVGVAAVSLFSYLTASFQLPTKDPLLGALYAGVVTGIGLGLIFRAGATTGGSDIIARFVRQKYGVSMGKVLFSIDVCVIGIVAFLIGRETAMYSLVALFVSSRVIDFVIEGAKTGKAVTIISDKYGDIVQAIHENLGRGTTLLQASGGYTGLQKQVVYCVLNREEVARVQQIVHDVDDRAFLVVNDVHEVLGEGFTYPSP